MGNFINTKMRQKFYNIDISILVTTMEEIAEELSRTNKLQEKELELTEIKTKLKLEERKLMEILNK